MTNQEKIALDITRLNIKNQSVREVSTRLGFEGKDALEIVQAALEGLVVEGTIVSLEADRYTSAQREKLIKGTLKGNRKGFAFLIREDKGADLFVPNRALNGAMHGDKVFAKIVKGDEAIVVSIAERGITELVGTFYREKVFGFVVPDDSNFFCDLFIPPKKCDNIPNKSKVVAKITGYTKGKNPEGIVTEVIGKVGEKRSDVLSILKAYGFFNEFSPEAIAEVDKIKNMPVGARLDLRNLLTVTIDGDDSKDFDDAITLLKEGNKYQLYVHIADVSHFVRSGSKLDEEALKRATSVYFPGSVYPMLPSELSNDICSLNPGEDRLALTVQITLNSNGDTLHTEIMESVIRSDRRMTYNNVTKILGNDEELCQEYADVKQMLFDMDELSALLDKKRAVRGAINFDTKESKILLDKEGNVDKIVPYNYTISNNIIEQFMVLANEVVAETYFYLQLPFVYRVHEKPDSEKIETFIEFAKGCGIDFSLKDVHPKALQTILEQVEGTPFQTILSKVMLRSMQKAKYSTQCLGHFGLALKFYSHFTSPIRRYPDLMIHRVIKLNLAGKLDAGNIAKIEGVCEEIAKISSEREKASEMAERDIDDYYKAEFMHRHLGEEFVGNVSGVTQFGVFVELENTCEGLARLVDLPKDNYNFLEKRFLLKGAKYEYSLGQKVKIKVLAASVEDRKVSFAIVEE